MPFSKLGLSTPIVKAVTEQGYTSPTPIQAKTIPVILSQRNLIAAAQTGTGKTASFVLPILEMLSNSETQRKKRIRALILTPTRELAVQVEDNISQYGKYLNLTSMAMYGGVDSKPQRERLIEGVDILVATPGRLLDMYTQRAIHFDELEILVLDEADRMLDMGFIEDINKIIDKLPVDRQSLLFSATLSRQVKELARATITRPIEISVTHNTDNKPKIEQWLVTVDKDKKSALLSHLIQENNWQQALIFIETKQGAAKLVSQLEKRGITAECIHGGRSQEVREQILANFKSGKIGLLIATGIAARGLDIDELPLVINYDLPYPADEYIHRIGRTGRAGANGEAVTLLSKDDFKNLCMIESRLGHLIERREVEGFAPRKAVPISILNYKPKNKPAASSDKKPRPDRAKPARDNKPKQRNNEGRDDRRNAKGTSSDNKSAPRAEIPNKPLPQDPWAFSKSKLNK
ncbi:DEAD/DEAH box helicase [Shewanella fidelis]|uniref:DEAD-box ATP-dependent RNA helicase RhpA n=1 Tax=Shewanella fidelis TaxID=173509 RepID=A0AAW8NL39_9GAMM|nr:DEAD/DEAH box helicase [Shewanella fidelis]MDR8523035.1 DEAD/DEAH box helicase [Shewanella fidelis]MDW4811639.1 DEAD/DEAH box helicase [Shewanella fidelis]MDW4815760.1 DEAD/DEAH box helicase [Shewanella fidelis]MDW4819850.1 DEAD/DEAH box helicase [Shewanella fidelis]MDW4824176.1 DEAD/DEAH box helicase [Shewanella fidelis]